MEARTAANRDEAIPVLRDEDGSKKKTKQPVQGEQTAGDHIQDRLLNKLLQQILPETPGSLSNGDSHPDKRSNVERPNFSLPTMSNNFRRLNARIGVVFVFQARVAQLFAWKTPTHTLSFLAVYTFCCLNPSLIATLPVACATLFVMTPAFLVRHPPPSTNELLDAGRESQQIPITPVPELSKDFFRNLRDLQNSMDDFSVAHDKVVALIAPLANFADEGLSTAVFLFSFLACSVMLVACSLVPWRGIFLLGGWAATCSLHPWAAELISSPSLRAQLKQHKQDALDQLQNWVESDIVLDEAPEVREVEIFELQHQRNGGAWDAWVFSTTPYDALSPRRVAGDRPRGARYFEEVLPPKGWRWLDKKWNLDPLSQEWVEERMITVVEIETDGDRWVYDLSASDSKSEREVTSAVTVNKQDGGASLGLTGEWRRRRWIRQAQRKAAKTARISIATRT